jgi:hypothetical protein
MGQHADDALNYFTRRHFGVSVVGDEPRKQQPKKGKKSCQK